MAVVCSLHKAHAPRPLTCDLHHVLPRAWQHAFSPASAPYPGSYDGEPLWDARTIPVAPTCHRNVHWWIVTLTRAHAGLVKAPAARTPERAAAQLALDRFTAAGGSLDALAKAGLWGEA